MEIAGWGGALAATVGVYTPTAVIAVGVSHAADRPGPALVPARHGGRALRRGGPHRWRRRHLWLKLPLSTAPIACAQLTAVALLLVFKFKQPPYVSIPVGMGLAWLLMG